MPGPSGWVKSLRVRTAHPSAGQGMDQPLVRRRGARLRQGLGLRQGMDGVDEVLPAALAQKESLGPVGEPDRGQGGGAQFRADFEPQARRRPDGEPA